MKVEIYIDLKSEMHLNTQFKKTLTNYTKFFLIRKRLVLLPVDWDKNGLLFTKRIHIKENGYS